MLVCVRSMFVDVQMACLGSESCHIRFVSAIPCLWVSGAAEVMRKIEEAEAALEKAPPKSMFHFEEQLGCDYFFSH